MGLLEFGLPQFFYILDQLFLRMTHFFSAQLYDFLLFSLLLSNQKMAQGRPKSLFFSNFLPLQKFLPPLMTSLKLHGKNILKSFENFALIFKASSHIIDALSIQWKKNEKYKYWLANTKSTFLLGLDFGFLVFRIPKISSISNAQFCLKLCSKYTMAENLTWTYHCLSMGCHE